MKNILVILILIILSGCGRNYRIEIKNDPFLKSKIYSLPMWHKVTEGIYDNYETIYSKDLKNAEFSPVSVLFKFRYMLSTVDRVIVEKFKNNAQMIIGNKLYEINLQDIKQQAIEDNTTKKKKPDTVDVNNSSGNAVYLTTSSFVYFDINIKMQLTEEMAKEINKTDKLMYRFYAGDEKVTLKADEKQLNALKKFINKKVD